MQEPTLVEIVAAVPSTRPLSFWKMAVAVCAGLWMFAVSAAAVAGALILLGIST